MATETGKAAPRPNCYPIIYVRGFAFSPDERDQTAADPYCGFNVGSTVFRATADKERPKSYFFESPLVRLASDFNYHIVYRDGLEIIDPAWDVGRDGEERLREGIPVSSIIIHRFYDSGSKLRGDGKTSSIEDYARELGRLIARVRELTRVQQVAQNPQYKDEDFRCYLVAHSMGGLVVRALLQNKKLDVTDQPPVRGCVAKVFTYATPHNGIDFVGINVPKLPGFLKDVSTFNRDVMRDYLDKQPIGGKVNYLPDDISPPPSNWFCMIGTNRLDYEVGAGMSRTFVGRGSDGLVRIDNATLWYKDEAARDKPVACAYAYRAHSGFFGIVNSEEAYQNLVRFFFGNFRVDLWLDIESVSLPDDVRAEEEKGRKVDAVYQVELQVSTRGKTWSLSRRKAEEDSPACRTYQQLKGGDPEVKSIHLSTVFLAKGAKVDPKRAGISYSVTLGIRAPDYEVDRAFWPDGHYEGVSLFRDSLIVVLYDPTESGSADGSWKVTYGWLKRMTDTKIPEDERTWVQNFPMQALDKPVVVKVPLHTDATSTATGIVNGTLRMEARAWS